MNFSKYPAVCKHGLKPSCFPVLQVLVVWDVSVGKARNYRLFEEVRESPCPCMTTHLSFNTTYGPRSLLFTLSQEQRVFLDVDVTFLSLEALVEHYHTHALPHHGSLCLQTPYGENYPR